METGLIIGLIVLVVVNLFLSYKASKSTSYDKSFVELKSNMDFIKSEILRVENMVRDEISKNREETGRVLKENREEIANSFKILGDSTNRTLSDISGIQKNQLGEFSTQLQNLTNVSEAKYKAMQEQSIKDARENRAELNNSLKSFESSFTRSVKDFNELQEQKFTALLSQQNELNKSTEDKLEKIRGTVEQKLQKLQEDNAIKLEEMRVTVDEKLQQSVEKRFNDSFRLISERLDQVHKGLGEMQTLAHGVGDLKKVLTNVKTRGTLGEIQLGCILEEILSVEQYERNALTRQDSLERVEFAVKLPGKNMDDNNVLLPIDSKFPMEDYQRLLDVYDNAQDYSSTEIEAYARQFESAVKKNAKDIRDKYINPPHTTDFAIMFVPTEGLYAEILRRNGLFDSLQREFKITVVGPSNLVAFLSSLQMGFRTLAIEKRSSEVWEVLGAVKTEFGKFAQILEKTKKKLEEATRVIETTGTRTRAIERKLRYVESLPEEESVKLLGEGLIVDDEDAQ